MRTGPRLSRLGPASFSRSPTSPLRGRIALRRAGVALLELLDLGGELARLVRLPRHEPHQLLLGLREISRHEVRLAQVLVRLRVFRLDLEALHVGLERA